MNTTFKSYRDLEVWQKSMRLAKRIYQITQKFPSEERFGLTEESDAIGKMLRGLAKSIEKRRHV